MVESIIHQLEVPKDKENKETIEVKKLHFLIHPGFGLERGKKSLQEDYLALLNKYESYLKTLSQDELVVIFKELPTFRKIGEHAETESISDKWRRYKTPSVGEQELIREEFAWSWRGRVRDPDKEWVGFVDRVKQALGCRVLVMGKEYDIFPTCPN